MTADIGIILGARAICSLIGLVIIFVGFWIKEKRFDDQGTIAYDKYMSTVDENYRAVDDETGTSTGGGDDASQPYNATSEKFNFHDNGSRDMIQMSSSDAEDRFPLPRSLQREIEAALPIPFVMLLGFLLLMISLIFSPKEGNYAYNSGWNIASIFILLAIAATYVVGLRKATLERKTGMKKKICLAVLFFTIWLGIAALADSEINAPWYFCTLAIIFIPSSIYVLYNTRKMGVTWDYNGKPNQEAVFNNGVSYLMVVGLYVLWIGLNAVDIDEYYDGRFVPIDTGVRAWFTCIGGLGIVVPSLIALEYAFERGSEVSGNGLNGDSLAALTKDFTWFNIEPVARLFETSFFYIAGWVVLAFSAFLPFNNFTLQMLFTSLLALCVGPIYGMMVLPTYWAGNMTDHGKYMYVYGLFMFAFAAVVGLRGGAALVMSIMSGLFIFLGQFLDFTEQKRGQAWLQDRKVNPSWSLFGMGHPIFVLGWILLCHGMSYSPDPDLVY